jgi:hypothetical protein
MAAARSTMRTRLKYRMSNRSDLTNAQLDAWLDAGLLDLTSRIRSRQQESTDATKTFTIGANTVTMPTTMIAVLDIRNTTLDQPLDYTEWTKYRKLKITSGTPRIWSVWGTTLYFDKNATAADALSMFGIILPTWAAADASVPAIDDQLEYGIELLAAAHGFRDIGEETKAGLIENPLQPGVGQFWAWVRANRLPRLLQGMASQSKPGIAVRLDGYDGVT